MPHTVKGVLFSTMCTEIQVNNLTNSQLKTLHQFVKVNLWALHEMDIISEIQEAGLSRSCFSEFLLTFGRVDLVDEARENMTILQVEVVMGTVHIGGDN